MFEMSRVTRRDAIKAFTGAGITLAASSALLIASAAEREGSSTSDMTSYRLQPHTSPNSVPSGTESVVLHLKDGKLVGYKGMQSFVFSDDELVSRIYQKFGE